MNDSGSWVITCLATGETFEIFGRDNAEKAKESPFVKVESIIEYLGRINREIKHEQDGI